MPNWWKNMAALILNTEEWSAIANSVKWLVQVRNNKLIIRLNWKKKEGCDLTCQNNVINKHAKNNKYQNFMASFGRLRQKIAPKSVPRVQHDYLFSFKTNHSTNQIILLNPLMTTGTPKQPLTPMIMTREATKWKKKNHWFPLWNDKVDPLISKNK